MFDFDVLQAGIVDGSVIRWCNCIFLDLCVATSRGNRQDWNWERDYDFGGGLNRGLSSL